MQQGGAKVTEEGSGAQSDGRVRGGIEQEGRGAESPRRVDQESKVLSEGAVGPDITGLQSIYTALHGGTHPISPGETGKLRGL